MWNDLHAESMVQYNEEGTGFVSDYARTNQSEDFAESYAAYIRDPEGLAFQSQEKYDFMRDYVFGGREYANIPLPA